MLEKDLDKLIDKAPASKVRECLKQITGAWFAIDPQDQGHKAFGGSRKLDFNKELNSDTLEEVTSTLHTFGFCPPEKE